VYIGSLLKKRYEYHYSEIDENNPENLSCISIFKLYAESDSTKPLNGRVNGMNLFLLEAGDVRMHPMSADHERRLEFHSKNYGLNNNWFFS
jgi:hypothetical protein